MRTLLRALLLFPTVLSTADLSAWADETKGSLSIEEVRNAWLNYNSAFDKVLDRSSIVVEVTVHDELRDNAVMDKYSLLARKYGTPLHLDYRSELRGREVFCINERYAFSVKPLNDESPVDGWVLTSLDPAREDAAVVRRIQQMLTPNLNVASLTDLMGVSLIKLTDPTWCRIDSVEAAEGQIVFNFHLSDHTEIDASVAFISTGKFNLIPEQPFACVSAEFSTRFEDQPGKFLISRTVGTIDPANELLIAVTTEARDIRSTSAAKFSGAVSVPSREAGDAAECFLPYYGITEPDWAGSSISWSMFFAIAGGMLLVVGVIARHRIRSLMASR